MADRPTGTVTFLFTDIEGSTEILRSLGDAQYARVLDTYRQLLRSAIGQYGGQEVSVSGDGMLVVFRHVRNSLQAAARAQQLIIDYAWPATGSVRVRMGIHTGEATEPDSGYVGLDVHRASRICAAGHGGQILMSEATRALADQNYPEGMMVRDLGMHRLKGLESPEHIFQLLYERRFRDFPPLRALSVLPNNLPRQLTRVALGRLGQTAP